MTFDASARIDASLPSSTALSGPVVAGIPGTAEVGSKGRSATVLGDPDPGAAAPRAQPTTTSIKRNAHAAQRRLTALPRAPSPVPPQAATGAPAGPWPADGR